MKIEQERLKQTDRLIDRTFVAGFATGIVVGDVHVSNSVNRSKMSNKEENPLKGSNDFVMGKAKRGEIKEIYEELGKLTANKIVHPAKQEPKELTVEEIESSFKDLPKIDTMALTGASKWAKERSDAYWKHQMKILFASLEELVQLKDWKASHGKDEHYLNNKEKAWNQAQETINLFKEKIK